MTYAVEHIANTLQNTRKAKGLTQRGLGRSAAVPQSHVSRIERGAVDLRVSSLVELARVLDLELMLVPRRIVPVVDSIIGRRAEGASAGKESEGRPLQELMRLQDSLGELLRGRRIGTWDWRGLPVWCANCSFTGSRLNTSAPSAASGGQSRPLERTPRVGMPFATGFRS